MFIILLGCQHTNWIIAIEDERIRFAIIDYILQIKIDLFSIYVTNMMNNSNFVKMSGTTQSTDYNQQILQIIIEEAVNEAILQITMENEAAEEEFPILPTVLENIIIDYVFQLDRAEIFQKCLNKINDINYHYLEMNNRLKLSRREIAISNYMETENVEYYQRNDENFLYIEHHYSFRGDTTIRSTRIHYGKNFTSEDLGISYD